MDQIELKYFLLADHVVEDKQGKVSLIGIFDTVNVKDFPATLLSSVIVARIAISDKNINKLNFSISLFDSTSKEIGKSTYLTTELPSESAQGERTANIIVRVQGIPFNKEDVYKFVLKLEDKQLGECRFRVVKLRE